MTARFWLDRTAAHFEELTWRLKLAALAGYALVWLGIYQLAA
jgi:hypothetical protein